MDKQWRELKIIKDFFQIRQDGEMPEGSRILLEAMDHLHFDAGDNIVTEGNTAEDGMYIILQGDAHVLIGGSMLVNELTAGDVVGELALIKEGTRKATVRAVTDVECAHISQPLFLNIADENRKVYAALLELLYTKTTIMVTERERLKSELSIASRIQNGYLPKTFDQFSKLPWIHIRAKMMSAKEVAGDFYDVFQIDDHRLCFLIADVAGKGIPASLFTMLAKTHVRNYMMLDMPLSEAARLVNNRLNEDNEEELFVTMFLCVLDTETNQLTYINAGHNKPFISRQNGTFKMMECKTDFVFGIMEDMSYREQSVELNPGDRIYLYTDGVTEAFDVHGAMFSDEKLEALLNQYLADADSPDQMIEHIYKEVSEFSKGVPQSDDITMLYLSRS